MRGPSAGLFSLLAICTAALATYQALNNRIILAVICALNGITIAIVALVRKENK